MQYQKVRETESQYKFNYTTRNSLKSHQTHTPNLVIWCISLFFKLSNTQSYNAKQINLEKIVNSFLNLLNTLLSCTLKKEIKILTHSIVDLNFMNNISYEKKVNRHKIWAYSNKRSCCRQARNSYFVKIVNFKANQVIQFRIMKMTSFIVSNTKEKERRHEKAHYTLLLLILQLMAIVSFPRQISSKAPWDTKTLKFSGYWLFTAISDKWKNDLNLHL